MTKDKAMRAIKVRNTTIRAIVELIPNSLARLSDRTRIHDTTGPRTAALSRRVIERLSVGVRGKKLQSFAETLVNRQLAGIVAAQAIRNEIADARQIGSNCIKRTAGVNRRG